MFAKFKLSIGHSSLRKRLKSFKRTKMVYNLDSARRVGIVSHLTNDSIFSITQDFVAFLEQRHLEVCHLAYFPGKELPQKYLMRKNLNIFTKKDLNWYGKPISPLVNDFTSMDFDILIDLSMQELFPLKWTTSLSKAKFKVGNLSYYGCPNDLIINVKPSDNLDYLISQIKHYLYLINNRFAQEKIENIELDPQI